MTAHTPSHDKGRPDYKARLKQDLCSILRNIALGTMFFGQRVHTFLLPSDLADLLRSHLGQNIESQTQPYANLPHREQHSGSRPSMFSQEIQAGGFNQGFPTRTDRFTPTGPVQAASAERGSWMEDFSQQRYAANPYQGQETNMPMYRSNIAPQVRQSQQYPPPVPPERQLSSSMSELERSQMQLPRQAAYGIGATTEHSQYQGRGPFVQPENVTAQENYQYPTRAAPPSHQQYGNFPNMPASYTNPSNLQGQGQQGSPSNYPNPYQYGRYGGQPPYR